MKFFLLCIGLTSLLNVAYAQKAQIGIQGGVNFSSVSASASDGTQSSSGSTNSATGFHIGLIADFPIGDFSLQPGLFFTTKGGADASTGNTVTFNYLEVPVNLLYNIKLPGANKFFLGGGPYLGYGIGGSEGVTFGSGDGDYSNPDIGLNFTAGFRFKSGFTIRGNYEFGLTNILNISSPKNLYLSNGSTSTENLSIKVTNRVFGASVGFFF